jgi:nicotinamide-nucleotide amidase
LIFGYDNETMEEVVGNLLRKKHATICTAESCTGGYLSHLITSVPGASEYYKGSVIAYDNLIKHDFLGVSAESLKAYGAVSEQVVREMAEGARNRFGCDYALATSGIAGPDGGTPEKPVGLVWIGLATHSKTITTKVMFGEHRGRNIQRASLEALNMIRLELLNRT